jgi:hypothetical protein
VSVEVWLDRPGRRVLATTLSRPYEFASPFDGVPFVLLLVVVDPTVTNDERSAVSDQIIASGCRYVCAAGHDCSLWDDSVDWSLLGRHDFNPPAAAHVMTSWHENEASDDTVDFALDCTSFEDMVFERWLVAFVGDDPAVRRDWQAAVRRRADQAPTK